MMHRAWRSLFVLLVALTLAAILQQGLPPVPVVDVKAPWLLALAVYYGVRREAGWAFAAAIGAGIVLDGLGCMPYGVSLWVCVLLAVVCVMVVRRQMADTVVTCLVVTVGVALLHEGVLYAALRASGAFAPVDAAYLGSRLLGVALVGAPVGGVVAAVVRHMDTALGNSGNENEGETLNSNAY